MKMLFDSALKDATSRTNRILSKNSVKIPDVVCHRATALSINKFFYQASSNTAIDRTSFNWSSRYDQVSESMNDILVAIACDSKICAISDYRYNASENKIEFIQIESLSGEHPLKGQITFLGLQIALSIANTCKATNIELIGPFYSPTQLEQYKALGFRQAANQKNMSLNVFEGMASFNYTTCQLAAAPKM